MRATVLKHYRCDGWIAGLVYRRTIRPLNRVDTYRSANKAMSLHRSLLYHERKNKRDGKGVIFMLSLDGFSPQTTNTLSLSCFVAHVLFHSVSLFALYKMCCCHLHA